MKKLIMLFYLITLALPITAQNFQEWWQQKKTKKLYLMEQIAALQAYGTVLKEGYRLTEQGLGLIQTIKNGDFVQHQDHFGSLSLVNPAIKDLKETHQIIRLGTVIPLMIRQTQLQLYRSDHLSPTEKATLDHVFSNIQKDTIQRLDELKQLLQNDALELGDSERIKRIRSLNNHVQQIYFYTSRFGQEVLQLTFNKEKKSHALEQIRQYHNVN